MNTMWLSDRDLKELEPLKSDSNLAKEKAGEVLSRQLRNIASSRESPFKDFAWITRWRTLAIAVPWTPTEPGSHLVKILVDPYGEPDDEDLHNNWREISVSVR